MLDIRTARTCDAPVISDLLHALGYPGTASFLPQRLTQLLAQPDAELLVACLADKVVGVISLHFIAQLALPGDFCRISYFCVTDSARGNRVGAMLEAHAEALARQRGCDRIEVHCHARRTEAHRFYHRQGYQESPKYLFKSLTT